MLFRQLFDHDTSTYTYLIADEATGEAALIDPVREQLALYLTLLQELGLRLRYAIDTHVHADHVTALGDLHEATGCTTVHGQQSQCRCVSQKVVDGEDLALGRLHLRALYTPGHTDDSYCYLLTTDHEPYLFTGDTLLIRGTGRTDFQNGDARQQWASLQRLLALPGGTRVYPAHDYRGLTMSTIAEERRWNPRLQVQSAEEYAELMRQLKLPNPRLMDIAVPANLACGRPS